MEQRQPTRSLEALCSSFGYSRQAYYKHLKVYQEKIFNEDLLIGEVHRIRKSQKRVGAKKLLVMIRPFIERHQISIGRDAFIELLRGQRLLVCKRRRTRPKTTFSNHYYRKHPNLIKEFIPVKANELWVSDITYIQLEGTFCYLSLITDAYSRKIIGFELGKNLWAQNCINALTMALSSSPPTESCIHHSDRGIQYCSYEYVRLLQTNNIKISMTENGDPRENPVAERVNGILKEELLEHSYSNFEEAEKAITLAISIYNNERVHLSVNMLTPSQAHHEKGNMRKHWKNYYHTKRKKDETIEGF